MTRALFLMTSRIFCSCIDNASEQPARPRGPAGRHQAGWLAPKTSHCCPPAAPRRRRLPFPAKCISITCGGGGGGNGGLEARSSLRGRRRRRQRRHRWLRPSLSLFSDTRTPRRRDRHPSRLSDRRFIEITSGTAVLTTQRNTWMNRSRRDRRDGSSRFRLEK